MHEKHYWPAAPQACRAKSSSELQCYIRCDIIEKALDIAVLQCKMELILPSLLLLCATSFADLSTEYKNKATLDGDSKYKVYWTHNDTLNMMYIAVEVQATGWVALAFTKEKSSSMKDYDTCLGYVSGDSKVLRVSCCGRVIRNCHISSGMFWTILGELFRKKRSVSFHFDFKHLSFISLQWLC